MKEFVHRHALFGLSFLASIPVPVVTGVAVMVKWRQIMGPVFTWFVLMAMAGIMVASFWALIRLKSVYAAAGISAVTYASLLYLIYSRI